MRVKFELKIDVDIGYLENSFWVFFFSTCFRSKLSADDVSWNSNSSTSSKIINHKTRSTQTSVIFSEKFSINPAFNIEEHRCLAAFYDSSFCMNLTSIPINIRSKIRTSKKNEWILFLVFRWMCSICTQWFIWLELTLIENPVLFVNQFCQGWIWFCFSWNDMTWRISHQKKMDNQYYPGNLSDFFLLLTSSKDTCMREKKRAVFTRLKWNVIFVFSLLSSVETKSRERMKAFIRWEVSNSSR